MKNNLLRYTFALALGGLVPLISAIPASADITFTFTKSLTGGVDVVGTGSGFADRVLGIATSDWDVQDFQTNFLKASFGTAQTSSDTIAGSFTNVTTGVSENFLNFDVDADGGPSSDNDLDYDTANVLSFALNDEYLFQLTASFDPGTLPFNQLVLGSHIDVGHTQGSGIADESFGLTIVNVIPEPGTLGLVLACFASLGAAGWRKRSR